jgi:hypothetical protein
MVALRSSFNSGYTEVQCRQIFGRVWHTWLPRKISSMQWLTMASGLPIGNWQAKAGWEGHYKICGYATEDAEHGLMLCPILTQAWALFQQLHDTSSHLINYLNWHQILYGLCYPLGQPMIQSAVAWDTSRITYVNEDSAWEILRTALLWHLWVQKCGQELNGIPFSLGKALYYAWKTCI